jgi:hypothetical protein
MKKPILRWARVGKINRSDLDYICCLRTFLALNDVKLHFLTFGQGFETITLNSGIVHKHIFSVFTGNKPKSFIIVKPLNFTSNCHVMESQVPLLRLNPPAFSTKSGLETLPPKMLN